MVYPPGSYIAAQQYSAPASSSSSSSKRSSETPASSSSSRPSKRRRKMDARVDGRNDFDEQMQETEQAGDAETKEGGAVVSMLESLLTRFGLFGFGGSKVESSAKGKGKQRQIEDIPEVIEVEDDSPASVTQEADDDEPGFFDHGASSRSYLTNNGATSSYVKRQPMYSNDVRHFNCNPMFANVKQLMSSFAQAKASSRAKSQARMQHLRASAHPSVTNISSSYGSPANPSIPLSPSTSNTSAALATPQSARNNIDAVMARPSATSANASSGTHGSFANYRMAVSQVNDTFGRSAPILPRSPSNVGRFARGDILAAKRPPKQQRYTSFDRALYTSKEALESEKPPLPSLKSFNRLNLKDQKTSEEIDDLTRRRRRWPAQPPPEIAKIVKAVFIQRGMISSLPAAEVSAKDIIKLRPGEWLNDEVINFYGVMVNLRSAAAKERRDKEKPREEDEELLDVHVFSSFFFAKLDSNGYQGVKKWTKKFDFFKKDIVIMPVNLGNAHWVCAAINLAKKRFEYYDSMGRINYGVTGKLRAYVEAEHLEKKKTKLDTSDWVDYYNPKTPQQANGYDCGVFTSQFIECLSRKDGHFDFSQHNMQYLRSKMVAEIKGMELMPEEWM